MDPQVLDTAQQTTEQETSDELLARVVASSRGSAQRVLDLRVEGGGE